MSTMQVVFPCRCVHAMSRADLGPAARMACEGEGESGVSRRSAPLLCHAMSGTDVAFIAAKAREDEAMRQVASPPYRPPRLQCDARD